MVRTRYRKSASVLLYAVVLAGGDNPCQRGHKHHNGEHQKVGVAQHLFHLIFVFLLFIQVFYIKKCPAGSNKINAAGHKKQLLPLHQIRRNEKQKGQ
jgi:hypothetical protein